MLVISLRIPQFSRILDTTAICSELVAHFGASIIEDDANEAERLRIEASLEQLAKEGRPVSRPDVIRGSFENRVRVFGARKRLTIPLPEGHDILGAVSEANAIFTSEAPETNATVHALVGYLKSLDKGQVTIGEASSSS